MKVVRFFMSLVIIMIVMVPVFAQKTVTKKMKVYGNCEMCEKRIEKAAQSLEGVSQADWDVTTKMLTVTFDKAKVSIDDIHKAVAMAGHDTQKMMATQEAYDVLDECCSFERAKHGHMNYHCPMHPEEMSAKKGNCSVCGMKMVKKEGEKMKHHKHQY